VSSSELAPYGRNHRHWIAVGPHVNLDFGDTLLEHRRVMEWPWLVRHVGVLYVANHPDDLHVGWAAIAEPKMQPDDIRAGCKAPRKGRVDDRLGSLGPGVRRGEIPPRDERHAERREEPGRHRIPAEGHVLIFVRLVAFHVHRIRPVLARQHSDHRSARRRHTRNRAQPVLQVQDQLLRARGSVAVEGRIGVERQQMCRLDSGIRSHELVQTAREQPGPD
jgi:hypothetical protein